jgi:TIR domain
VPVGMKGNIFISYQREEADDFASLLTRELQRDGYRVFIDIEKIKPSVNWPEGIQKAVSNCAVLLALIGRDWLEVKDAHGRRRQGDPDDVMRGEIEAALQCDVPVIPVLIKTRKCRKGQNFPRACGHWPTTRPRPCGTTPSPTTVGVSRAPLTGTSSHRAMCAPSQSSPDCCLVLAAASFATLERPRDRLLPTDLDSSAPRSQIL